jgi:hypothetical protein
MVCISLVYCNGVCMCVHPFWTEAVHACRCSIDRRCAVWCGVTDSSVSVAIGGERRRGGTDSPATASRRSRPGLCTYTVLVSITMLRLIVCSTRKRCTSTRWIHSDYRFWVSFGIHLQFRLKSFWTNFKFIAHGPSFKFPFMSSFSASFHTTPRSLFLSSFFLKFESVISFESKVWFVIYFNIWVSSDYIFKTRSILDTFWKSFSFECEILVKLVSYLTCFYSMFEFEYNRGFMHIFIGQLFESINHMTTFREQNEKTAILSNLSSHTA